MNLPRRFRRIVALLAFCAAPTHAELSFKKPVQEFHRTPEDREIIAKFPFQNTGARTTTIRRVKTSCGCTTTSLAKDTFAPGEKGDIEARFAFGGRRGPQRKLITVATDDGRESLLELRCWIEEPLTVSPALVFWKVGDPAEPKQVDLVAGGGQKVHVTGVASSNPRIAASVATLAAGERYAVKVRPAATAQKESAQITVQTDFPPDAPRRYSIHVRVK